MPVGTGHVERIRLGRSPAAGRYPYTVAFVAPPKRKAGGRVTPKGTRPGDPKLPTAGEHHFGGLGHHHDEGPKHASTPSSRYTPPVPVYMKQSPRWVPILMFALWIIGALVIICYYLDFLPGGRSQWYLAGGLALILAGLYTATKYR